MRAGKHAVISAVGEIVDESDQDATRRNQLSTGRENRRAGKTMPRTETSSTIGQRNGRAFRVGLTHDQHGAADNHEGKQNADVDQAWREPCCTARW